MKELALHILDIAKNSVSAGASWVKLNLSQTPDRTLTIEIEDDGRGMEPEFLALVTDPFTTTRTTRKVGLGLPLFRLAAEQTGGTLAIESTPGVGTKVTAVFHTDHLDCAPMGDLPGTVAILIQGSPGVDVVLTRSTPRGSYQFSTHEVRNYLGDDIPLDEPEIFLWLVGYLEELESEVKPAPSWKRRSDLL